MSSKKLGIGGGVLFQWSGNQEQEPREAVPCTTRSPQKKVARERVLKASDMRRPGHELLNITKSPRLRKGVENVNGKKSEAECFNFPGGDALVKLVLVQLHTCTQGHVFDRNII
jgi:hypothetical protein